MHHLAHIVLLQKGLNKLLDLERSQLKVKFDLAYFVATEKMVFSKHPKLCELVARHGIGVGTTYTNKMAGEAFTHYIAKAKRQELAKKLDGVNFSLISSLLLVSQVTTINISLLLSLLPSRNGTD